MAPPQITILGLLVAAATTAAMAAPPTPAIDFNLDIRPILSNRCFQCHGPDAAQRKANLRLDREADARADLDGRAAVIPGAPDASQLILRVTHRDADERMPPPQKGDRLTDDEVELLRRWIDDGAKYARHWSYVEPERATPPPVKRTSWPRGEIDRFLLARLERGGLTPAPEADRRAIARRVALDLTGLPPTASELSRFLDDTSENAYESHVDRLLAKRSYGEHWARMWLDLARYADSAGYADDPPRTIWAYRDWVIRSLNANKPFDVFTVEQIAGDLLPEPTDEQLIGTAFHRNTLTNNEGGTNDEEFRNVAIVDRVNTTMEVWMGTTIACAQCHNHKYDPISQEEYFRLFAIFNNTQDADRRNEAPTLPIWTDGQLKKKRDLEATVTRLREKLSTPTPELLEAKLRWQERLEKPAEWSSLAPSSANARSGAEMKLLADHSALIEKGADTDIYSFEFQSGAESQMLTALRIEVLPHDSLPGGGPGHSGGNFVLSRVLATVTPPGDASRLARQVRVALPRKGRMLSLAEVQVFGGGKNIATSGKATQNSTDFDGPAKLAIDGNTDGLYHEARSTTHTAITDNPWWELDLGSSQPVDRIVVWNRTDGELQQRLDGARLSVLDEKRSTVWERTIAKAPETSVEFALSSVRDVTFATALAGYSQEKFAAQDIIDNPDVAGRGWAIGGATGKKHALTLIPTSALQLETGSKLSLGIEQLSRHTGHTIGRLRVSISSDARAGDRGRLPPEIRSLLELGAEKRDADGEAELTKHYLEHVSADLSEIRKELTTSEKHLSEIKADTSVPIQRDLTAKQRRKTRIQRRGNFLDVGKEVSAGLPAVFHTPPEGAEADRLTLARWLVDERNPLTARVIVNRLWEKIFGVGLVRTIEEFGSQGELPSHPELLDWLATELLRQGWDVKALLRTLVTSAAYRQSSRVTPELLEKDPDNRLLARGPRFRLSAEMVRDQALFVSGLLSEKMYGPPAKPPQPKLGVSAAFGGGIDWKTSSGEDRYRRGLYTTWRRSNPYPSMAAFDAPSREVCTGRRGRTNTPIQALVTLNDEVYIEAAQALARDIASVDGSTRDRATAGFLRCLGRPPSDMELDRLIALFETARTAFAKDPGEARLMASKPLGPLPEDSDPAELAAWTVVGNVLLNLDEMLMKR